jgi:hypothetical protein
VTPGVLTRGTTSVERPTGHLGRSIRVHWHTGPTGRSDQLECSGRRAPECHGGEHCTSSPWLVTIQVIQCSAVRCGTVRCRACMQAPAGCTCRA